LSPPAFAALFTSLILTPTFLFLTVSHVSTATVYAGELLYSNPQRIDKSNQLYKLVDIYFSHFFYICRSQAMTLSFSVAEAPADPSASAGRHVPQDAVAKVGEGDEGLEV
jgi:hypothetical protein